MAKTDLPIGELFLIGFENDRIGLVEEFYRSFDLGGVIIFARNVESPSLLKKLIDEIKSRTAGDLIVAVDQEGGEVNRLTGSEFPVFASPAHYGERQDLEGAIHAARVTSRELIKLGINMNLSPVADVLTNRENALMERRCFSGDMQEVSEFTAGVISAQSEAGVASCAKHFPGLGDVSADPHSEIAVCDRPFEFVRDSMLPPFTAAIRAGVQAVMTTHMLVPSVDPTNIATFSPRICTEILRGSLCFGGVIISDDLNMGAVKDAKRAVSRAIAAGHDMALLCHSADDQTNCAAALWDHIQAGDIPRSDIVSRIGRVRNLKRTLEVSS